MKKMLIICFMLNLISYAFAVKVSPIRFDLTVARGSTKEFTIDLEGSKGLYNQNLMIYPSDLSMSRSGALLFTMIKDNKNSATSWIKSERDRVSLLENQMLGVKFKVSVPYGAIPGEYYSVIIIKPVEQVKLKDPKRPLALNVRLGVAVIIVLEVPGRTFEKKGEISDIKIIESDSLLKVSASFKNNSDVHLDVASQATIRSADGKVNYGTFDLKTSNNQIDKAFIFPGVIRDFQGILKKQLPSGDYIADIISNYGYDFKKAKQSLKFSIKRDKPLNENNAEYLRLNSKEIRLFIPKGGRRSQIIELTNIDYRPLNVTMASADWISIVPSTLTLKPGEVRKIQASIDATFYDMSQKKEALLSFKTDRGKSVDMKVFVTGQQQNLLVKDTTAVKKKVSSK
jgi:hypothetical protein